MDSVQALVVLAQNRLGYTRLLANTAGVITARGAEPGEVMPAGRMALQIANENTRDAVFDVPASIKDSASADAVITVSLSGDPAVSTTAKVYQIAPRADPVTGTFSVRVRLHNPPAAMRLGSTVSGRMELASVPGIQIPASAMTADNGKPAVWVVDPVSATVGLRAVTVRSYDAAQVLVESGLSAGDVVVTAGVQALRPAQKVRLLKDPS